MKGTNSFTSLNSSHGLKIDSTSRVYPYSAKLIYNELKNCLKSPMSLIENSFELRKKLEDLVLDDHVFLPLDLRNRRG